MYVPLRHKGYAISQSHSIFKSNTQSNFLINNLNTFSMKKLLLASLAFFAAATVVAQNVTIDFKTATKVKYEDNQTFPVVQKISNVDVSFLNSNAYIFTDTYGNYKDDAGNDVDTNVLFLNKNTPKGAMSFATPIACKKLVFKSTMGGSTSKNAKVQVYADDVKVGDAIVMSNPKGSLYTVELGSKPAGTVFKFEAAGSSNAQIETIEIVAPTTQPTLTAELEKIDFAMPLKAYCTKTIKVMAENIEGNITATCPDGNVTVTPATFTAEEGLEGVEIKYTGSDADEVATKVTFTAGDIKAEVAINALVISNEGTEASPLTINDVFTLNNLYTGTACVEGKIANGTAGNAQNGMVTLVTDQTKWAATNIVLTEGEKMIGVALPVGDTRTKLNIKDTPDNVGKTVVVKGTLEAYFGAPGVKNAEYISGLSGVENVGVDAEQGVVKYYNLQGVEVANPESGLYIRVQGDKATKVIL